MTAFHYRRTFLKALLGFSVSSLAVLTIYAGAPSVARSYPLNSLIFGTAFVVAAIAVVLYVGELVLLGWAVDLLSEFEIFLSDLGLPKIRPKPVPFEYEQVGEIIVVTLHHDIASLRECQSVQKQLKRLIDEHHCDFVLDFSNAQRISTSFRGVLAYFMKAARTEARKLGRPFRPVTLARGTIFPVFDDRQGAVDAMSKHDGHGWVVLCCVPVGIRAVWD